MDRKKSSLRFIPSSDFIIGVNCKRGQYFTADTILWYKNMYILLFSPVNLIYDRSVVFSGYSDFLHQ